MKQVTLEQLACEATEDWIGADDCRLEVYADGALEDVYRTRMDNGDTWPLNISLLFDQAASVRLFDEDTPDADDLLGTITVAASDDGHLLGAFDADGADYRLSYVVTDRDDVTAEGLLEADLQAFEASQEPGVWTHVSKEALIADMRATLGDPVTEIDQNRSSFCGPTAIVFELAGRMPRRYVRLCRWLYEIGAFVTATGQVTASEELRSMGPGHGMSVADWMLVATMRESENAVFGVDPGGSDVMNGVEGLTTPWEMEGWTREVLCKANAATSTTFLWGEMDALRYAERVHQAGGVAFLLIHDVLLDDADQTSFVRPWPTHWVAYRGGLNEADGSVAFTVYTWGEDRAVSRTVDRLESCLFAIVTGF